MNLKFVNDKRYMSLHSLIKDKMIFNFDFLFGEISHDLVPLDYDAFYNSTEEFYAFVTTASRAGASPAKRENAVIF